MPNPRCARHGRSQTRPAVARRGGRCQPPSAMASVKLPSILSPCFCIQIGNKFELLSRIQIANSMVIQTIIFELWPFQYHGCFGIEPLVFLCVYSATHLVPHLAGWTAGRRKEGRHWFMGLSDGRPNMESSPTPL
jgi:hypothetical protein